jgi:hypothetical protein
MHSMPWRSGSQNHQVSVYQLLGASCIMYHAPCVIDSHVTIATDGAYSFGSRDCQLQDPINNFADRPCVLASLLPTFHRDLGSVRVFPDICPSPVVKGTSFVRCHGTTRSRFGGFYVTTRTVRSKGPQATRNEVDRGCPRATIARTRYPVA